MNFIVLILKQVLNSSSANCHCKVQTEEIVVAPSKLSFDKKEFFDGFYSTLYNSNFRVVKCVKLLFSLKGMKSNYGFYFMTILSGFFLAFVIIYIIKGNGKIINIIINIISRKEVIGTNDNNIHINIEKKEEKIKEREDIKETKKQKIYKKIKKMI